MATRMGPPRPPLPATARLGRGQWPDRQARQARRTAGMARRNTSCMHHDCSTAGRLPRAATAAPTGSSSFGRMHSPMPFVRPGKHCQVKDSELWGSKKRGCTTCSHGQSVAGRRTAQRGASSQPAVRYALRRVHRVMQKSFAGRAGRGTGTGFPPRRPRRFPLSLSPQWTTAVTAAVISKPSTLRLLPSAAPPRKQTLRGDPYLAIAVGLCSSFAGPEDPV